jgi:hypothetical protein
MPLLSHLWRVRIRPSVIRATASPGGLVLAVVAFAVAVAGVCCSHR